MKKLSDTQAAGAKRGVLGPMGHWRKELSVMSLNTRGTRRALSFACSTVVVAAGASFFATPATAATASTTGLGLSGSTSITTLDFGNKISATLTQDATSGAGTGVLADNFEAATYAYHVTSALSSSASKLALVLDSYAAPTGSSPATGADGTDVTNAALIYGEATAASSVPANKWKSITTGNTATNYYLTDPVSQAHARDTHVTATQPGTYTFHFVDTGASLAGSDDDVTSNTITMTVLDAFAATVATTDDWAPVLAVNSTAVKLGAPVTATVPLSALSVSDARGTSSGVGTLASKLGALVGFGFKTADQSSDAARDLGYFLVTDSVAVNADPTVDSADADFVAGDVGWTGYATGIVANQTIATITNQGSVELSGNATAAGLTTMFRASTSSYGVDYTGTGLPTVTPLYTSANNSVGANSVSVTIPANTVLEATTVTAGAAIDQAGLGTFLKSSTPRALSTNPATAYATSGVTAWYWGPDEVAGSVSADTTSAVTLKTGTATATYSATVDTLTSNSYSVAGQTVYFTVAPGSAADSVSGSGGTLVSSVAATGTKIYSVTTNADGVATLTVTATGTSVGKTYTVKASLNGVDATASAGTTLVSTGNTTVTYADVAPSEIVDTSGAANLYPSVTKTSVTLSGKLVDQFGAVSQPGSASAQQATITVGGTAHFVPVTAGLFSYTYTPSSTPSAGSTTAVLLDYGALTQVPATIHWVSATATGGVTVTTPATGATAQTLADHTIPAGNTVSGYVTDVGGSALAYKLVTLSGSDGVYFSTNSSGSAGLAKTLEVGADASGMYSAYAFYTDAGTVTLTATADSKSGTSSVTTDESEDPYKVIIKDAMVVPGGSVVVNGEVKDAFGNMVPSAYVDLSLGSSALGTLSTSNPATNSGGVFSATFNTSDTSSEGTATITAKLRDTWNNAGSALMTANLTPHAGWATGGVTVPAGAYMDQASITVVKAQATTISGPASRVGSGMVTLTGKAIPGVVVEIYSRPAGSSSAFGWIDSVMSDESNGNWSASENITASTTFIAKTSTSTSGTTTVAVVSAKPTVKKATVTLKVTSLGKGKVKVNVNGAPNMKGTITVYVAGKKVKSFNSNAWGDGTLTVKASKGKKTVKVVFAPKGYTAGSASKVATFK